MADLRMSVAVGKDDGLDRRLDARQREGAETVARQLVPTAECLLSLVPQERPDHFHILAGSGPWAEGQVGSEWPQEGSLAGRDYGPITPLLNDDAISEVMVNGPNQVYIERKGQLTPVNVKFASDAELIRVIREIAAFVGRRIDEESPMVDCRLPDGSRVNAITAVRGERWADRRSPRPSTRHRSRRR